MKDLEIMMSEGKLEEQELFGLEKRRLTGNLIRVFKCGKEV